MAIFNPTKKTFVPAISFCVSHASGSYVNYSQLYHIAMFFVLGRQTLWWVADIRIQRAYPISRVLAFVDAPMSFSLSALFRSSVLNMPWVSTHPDSRCTRHGRLSAVVAVPDPLASDDMHSCVLISLQET